MGFNEKLLLIKDLDLPDAVVSNSTALAAHGLFPDTRQLVVPDFSTLNTLAEYADEFPGLFPELASAEFPPSTQKEEFRVTDYEVITTVNDLFQFTHALNEQFPEVSTPGSPEYNPFVPYDLLTHDLDVFAGPRSMEKLLFHYHYPIKEVVNREGNFPGPIQVISPVEGIEIFPYNWPFDGHTLPGRRDISATAHGHDFGSPVGILPVVSAENILLFDKALNRPKDPKRLRIASLFDEAHKKYARTPNPTQATTIFSAEKVLQAA